MKSSRKEIKVSACMSLIKIKKQYLGIAVHCLQEELSREKLNKEIVYYLCDYVTIINKIISYFTILIDNAKGDSVEIVYAQAIVVKTYMANFKLLKRVLMHHYNIFVEIN